MFNQILLPVDGSSLAECVLPHVIAIARAFESQVMLVHVMDPPHQATSRRAVDPLNWQMEKAEAESYLGDQALRLQEAGLQTETHILEGSAAEQIIEFSRTNDVPLIVLSSHGQSGLSEWNVSSVVYKITLGAHTSIMIVRAYQPISVDVAGMRYRRILLLLDGSQRAECALPVASTLARYHNAQILLAHVVRRPELPRRTPPTQEDIELAERIVQRNLAEAIQYHNEVRSHLPGDIQSRVLVSDMVAATLHELVDQEQIDLVLLTAHGYSALTQWPFGNLVNSFITQGTTSLLIVQDLPQDKTEPTRAALGNREQER